MRLPYAPSTPPSTAPQSEQDIYARISARRSPRPLQPLDLALLHSPPIADGWNAFLGAVRTGSILPSASVQELAICRIAVLNRAPYEWDAHSILAVKGEDAVSAEGMESVLRAEEFVGPECGRRLARLRQELGTLDRSGGLSAKQWAVIAYADQMTREVQVREEVWKAVRDEFEEREVVELTLTISAYNCVSRFLAALDVGERNDAVMDVPAGAK